MLHVDIDVQLRSLVKWLACFIISDVFTIVQAHSLSRDHKPDLEAEKDRILKAGGFIHAGRVNGSLNLARAIGM